VGKGLAEDSRHVDVSCGLNGDLSPHCNMITSYC
jgi:hypothetical protein